MLSLKVLFRMVRFDCSATNMAPPVVVAVLSLNCEFKMVKLAPCE